MKRQNNLDRIDNNSNKTTSWNTAQSLRPTRDTMSSNKRAVLVTLLYTFLLLLSKHVVVGKQASRPRLIASVGSSTRTTTTRWQQHQSQSKRRQHEQALTLGSYRHCQRSPCHTFIRQQRWVDVIPRGGADGQEKDATKQQLQPQQQQTAETTALAVIQPPPPPPPASLLSTSTSKSVSVRKVPSLSNQLHTVNRATRAWKRKQFWMLVALRFVYLLLAPISVFLWLVALAVSTLVHVVYAITFSLVGGQVRIMTNAIAKAGLALLLASITGILLPVFASFGLVISVLQCGLELTEPLLRIKYQRQLRKIKHLHKLLQDPVLVETLQSLLKGASAVSKATQRSVTHTTRRGVGFLQKSLPSQEQLAKTSTDLVEQLLQSSGAVQSVLEDFQTKAPQPVFRWTQQQYTALKQSGLLEEAANRALKALQGELQAASAFLPYLDAIDKVRQQQQKEKDKQERKSQSKRTKR